MATIGTSAAPTTEKQPLIPQAQMNMPSFPSRASQVMPTAMGKPIRNAGGAMRAKEITRRQP